MRRLARMFSKSPSDLLERGDRYHASECFFEARTCYEDGLQRCTEDPSEKDVKAILQQRIQTANDCLAQRNLLEAETALSRNERDKASDHIDLVKSLTCDKGLLEKAEKLYQLCSSVNDAPRDSSPATASSCNTCSQGAHTIEDDTAQSHETLPLMEYYDLLIRQLPEEQYDRYSCLGEEFAYAYLAASNDSHTEALAAFESCSDLVPLDIYLCERGKVLHRLGRESEAEQTLRAATESNPNNTLAWFNLALLLQDSLRMDDALQVLGVMIAENMLPEQALLMRAEVYEQIGDRQAAINQCIDLLPTSFTRPAAEKLHGLLLEDGRERDAEIIYKNYLGKCCH